ncbi:GtrA family protein [Nocardiopsis lambiniae]|uniref:GtrA family protein n=1 Tax=Nocardiopsis lambiniae TaxID=3075539 RepID=A0ABU2MG78_9ACTN|nr:GtrA family protein [Nocardiopsis sp. DSM 44743]MDT0331709.1 GtrA family protein [Nocardiopsis sp. DSM 44743]
MRTFLTRRPRLAELITQLGKFGSVGAVAYAVQLAATNLLWGVVGLGPLTGQVLGTLVAIAVAFVGNRFWTFADRARTGFGRETFLFLLMNGVGLLIQLGCQWFSVYVLGLDGPVAQNIAGNVVGVGLGTLFRFFSYRTWVFPEPPAAVTTAEGPGAEDAPHEDPTTV